MRRKRRRNEKEIRGNSGNVRKVSGKEKRKEKGNAKVVIMKRREKGCKKEW